jgi:hypothetical protein
VNVTAIVAAGSLAGAAISTLLAYFLGQLPPFGPKSIRMKIALISVLTVISGLITAKITLTSSNAPSQPATSSATGNDTDPPSFDNDIRLPESLKEPIDLDLNPPRSNSDVSVDDVIVSSWETVLSLSTSKSVYSGTWDDATDPTRDKCSYAATSMGRGLAVNYPDPKVGDGLCLVTNQKHVVFLRIKSVDDTGIVAHAIRWD